MTNTATNRRGTPRSSAAYEMHYLWIAAACAAPFAWVYVSHLRGSTIPVHYFLPAHIALELSSVVVSFAVFITGWFGYRQTGRVRDLFIGVTFAAVGMVDFVHTLSYKGMPDFLSQNSTGEAAAYWLLARLMVGVGLVAASCVTGTTKRAALYPWLALTGAVGIVAMASLIITVFSQDVSTALYPMMGQPPSSLKVRIEFVVIALYIVAFLLLTERRAWGPSEIRGLRSALIFAIFAEIAFMMYLSPYAWMNGLGHIYKTAAYVLILNALFVTAVSKPYQQLSDARDEMKALYDDARQHRREMETSFASVGSALSSSLDLREALDLMAELAVQMLHVNCSVVASTPRDHLSAQVTAQRGTCHTADRPIDLTLTLGERLAKERKPMLIHDLTATGWVDCDFSQPTCLRSMICVPMVYNDEMLGVIAVYSHSLAAFEEGDVKLLEGFAAHAAVATHNAASFEHESRIADVLQRALIGRSAVSTDRFEVAQVYQPAMNEALVGGDFCDVFETKDGQLALVIGDVAGKGLKAAVHTALVKYSLRAYVDEGHSPGATLKLLNVAVCRSADSDTFITMFLGILDPNTGDLVYANAGHEPPIHACAGTFGTLLVTGPVVGVWPDADYDEETSRLGPGCLLLLYTDGISEARRGYEFLGVEGIGERLQACEEMGCEDIARCVHHAAIDFAGGELRDDAAVVAIRAK